MVATTSVGHSVPSQPDQIATQARMARRRRIGPEAGHALEILGHAIEYLTDEYVHDGGALNPHDARLDAIHLLMARDREVYFACPEVPGLGERILAFLHLRRSWHE